MAIIKVKTGGITADAVTDALIADDVVGTEHLTANEVDTAALKADAVTGAELADNAVNSEHYTDGSIDNAHIADDAIDSEHYAAGSIDTAHIADAQITTAKLATAVFTGATDIGAAIADADLFLMDDGAGGTIRKTAASRIKTYAGVTPIAAEMDRGDNQVQVVANATGSTVVFSRERFDLGGCADPSNNKFIIPSGEGGKYFFYFRIGYSNPNTTGHRILYLRRANSGGSFGGVKEFQDNGAMFGAAAATGWVGSAIMDMNEGQEADLQIYQASGANLSTNPVSGQNLFFGMFKLPGTS